MFTAHKRYDNLPAAHRLPTHQGHCRFIHGHNWAFEFQFKASKLDDNGFVIDFGDLEWLKDYMVHAFDHTLLLNSDDSLGKVLSEITEPDDNYVAKVRFLPCVSCEGIAAHLMGIIGREIEARYTTGRVWLAKVIVFEDSKNAATVTCG